MFISRDLANHASYIIVCLKTTRNLQSLYYIYCTWSKQSNFAYESYDYARRRGKFWTIDNFWYPNVPNIYTSWKFLVNLPSFCSKKYKPCDVKLKQVDQGSQGLKEVLP